MNKDIKETLLEITRKEYEEAMKKNEEYRQKFETLKNARRIVQDWLKDYDLYEKETEGFIYRTLSDGLDMMIKEMDENINGVRFEEE